MSFAKPTVVTCLIAAALLFPLACSTQPGTPPLLSDPYEVSATVVPGLAGPPPQIRYNAIRTGENDCRNQIRDHFSQTKVEHGRTVLDFMAADAYVWSKVMELLKKTESHEQIDREDGKIEMRMRIDMDLVRHICLEGVEERSSIFPHKVIRP